MGAQSNKIGVDITKHNVVAMGSLVSSDTIHKSVLGAIVNGLSRHDVTDLSNDKKFSINVVMSIVHGPNGPMARFLVITIFLTILEHRSNGYIFQWLYLHHGEVPWGPVLISRRSSNFANIPSVKFPLGLSVTF
jgi:hypothetical protein